MTPGLTATTFRKCLTLPRANTNHGVTLPGYYLPLFKILLFKPPNLALIWR